MPVQPRTKPNPKDFTGNRKRILEEQHREELAQRQGEISMRQAEATANLDNPIELTKSGDEVRIVEAPEGPVQIPPDFVNVRIACDLEKVTIGQGNIFEFKEGQVYRLPLNVALHLHNLGYVWQWL